MKALSKEQAMSALKSGATFNEVMKDVPRCIAVAWLADRKFQDLLFDIDTSSRKGGPPETEPSSPRIADLLENPQAWDILYATLREYERTAPVAEVARKMIALNSAMGYTLVARPQ